MVLADEAGGRSVRGRDESLIAYDSGVLDPKEINVAVAGGRVTRFGVNYAGYSGAYAGMFRLSAPAARLFAATLDRPRAARLQRAAHLLLLRDADG